MTPDIHDLVRELTEAHQHAEPYQRREGGTTWTDRHITRVPSLLDQLQHADQPSTGAGGAGGYDSRPAASLEALDTLIRIDLEAARWVRDLGEDDPGDTAACIRKLHGLHASATEPAQRDIERDIRRWWNQARIATGWDSPAWRPDNTCPLCGKRGTLRVRLSAHAAICIEGACRTTWDADTIGLLAEHIRSENADADEEASCSA